MSIISKVKSFLFPYDEAIKEVHQLLQEQTDVLRDTNGRVKKMIATLNGEEDWFLRVVRPDEERKKNDRVSI